MLYSKPPITEAIIDIQVENTGCDLEMLRALRSKVPGYVSERAINFLSSQFVVPPDPTQPSQSTSSACLLGYIFWAGDNTRAWQARQNGFGISHLRPYQNWDLLVADARNAWAVYRREVTSRITRVAVRFINRFDLPNSAPFDFTEYFHTVPKIAKEMDTGLSGFSMQLVQPQTELASTLVLNLVQIPPAVPGTVAVVLDLDLARDVEVPQDEESLWALISRFRNRKNQLFEWCITDKTRGLIR